MYERSKGAPRFLFLVAKNNCVISLAKSTNHDLALAPFPLSLISSFFRRLYIPCATCMEKTRAMADMGSNVFRVLGLTADMSMQGSSITHHIYIYYVVLRWKAPFNNEENWRRISLQSARLTTLAPRPDRAQRLPCDVTTSSNHPSEEIQLNCAIPRTESHPI